jgi:hypothetical protein
MTTLDGVALRRYVYTELVVRGMPPKVADIGDRFGVSESDAKAALATLKIGKTIYVSPRTGEISMCGPFSAMPTAYRVSRDDTRWYANCAWDMLGIPFVIGRDVTIESSCGDCGERIAIHASATRAPTLEAVVHFLVPGREWYKDLEFT